jgi:hypothetical protein
MDTDEFSNDLDDINDDINDDIHPLTPLDLSRFQHNLNTFYKSFDNDITFVYKAVPMVFYMDYKPMEIYEQSQKIIAPKDLLTQLTGYENLELPIYIKLNDSDRIFGIIDYIDFIDHIYLPSRQFYDLSLVENEDTIITVLKDRPVSATEIKIKPLNDEFYEIQNIKTYLEVWLKKMYITLSKGEIITLPYSDGYISLYIEDTQPEPIVSIYDIEEVRIDLLPMDEYANKQAIQFDTEKLDNISPDNESPSNESLGNESSSNESLGNESSSNESPSNESSSNALLEPTFIPFSGSGHTLGSS